MMRTRRIAAGVLLILLLMPSMIQVAGAEQLVEKTINSDQGAVYIGSATLPAEFSYGTPAEIKFPLVNGEERDISNVRVTLKADKDAAVYPFKNSTTNNFVALSDTIKTGKKAEIKFAVDVQENALTQNYNLEFQISYVMKYENDKESITERVNITQAMVISVKGNPENISKEVGEGSTEEDTTSDSSTDSGTTASAGEATEEEGKVTTPRVIIEGFTTTPATVNAGDTFTLNLQVKNTSKKTAVSNMVITLQAPKEGADDNSSTSTSTAAEAFLPVSGSTTLYIENIPKDSVKEVSIDLTARADLVQKPYAIEAAMRYEGEGAEPYEGTASISVPIKQSARFELSQVEIMPEIISVGEEANVTFSIYNMGRTKLYNVWAKLENSTLSGAETYVGNIEAGATGTVDLMAMGAEETADDGTVKIVVTYEDQDGNQGVYESSCTLFVTAALDTEASGIADWEEFEEDTTGSIGIGPVIGIVVGGIVVIGIIVTIVMVRKKHKKAEDFTDEFFGSDQDE